MAVSAERSTEPACIVIEPISASLTERDVSSAMSLPWRTAVRMTSTCWDATGKRRSGVANRLFTRPSAAVRNPLATSSSSTTSAGSPSRAAATPARAASIPASTSGRALSSTRPPTTENTIASTVAATPTRTRDRFRVVSSVRNPAASTMRIEAPASNEGRPKKPMSLSRNSPWIESAAASGASQRTRGAATATITSSRPRPTGNTQIELRTNTTATVETMINAQSGVTPAARTNIAAVAASNS